MLRIKMIKNIIYAIGMLVLLLAACMPSQESPTPQPVSATPKVNEVQPTFSPTIVETANPSTQAADQLQSGPVAITSGNAGQLAELSRLGKGAIQSAPVSSPDGKLLAVPTSAGVYIFDAQSWQEQNRLPVGTSFIAFSPDSSLLAASRESVTLWDPASGELVNELQGSPGVIFWDVVFSPDGSLVAATSWDREVVVWALPGGEQRYILPGDQLQFSPDGQFAIVVTLGENLIHLYETGDGKIINQWNFRQAGFSPTGLIWLEDQGSVQLADAERDLLSAPFRGNQPSFSPDGVFMALYDRNQVLVYDHQAGRRHLLLEGSYVRVEDVLFSPDGSTLAGDVFTLRCSTCLETDGLDHYLVLWSAVDGGIIAQYPQPESMGMLAFSPDGKALIGAQIDSLHILGIEDNGINLEIDGFSAPVTGMVLDPQSNRLAAVYAKDPYIVRLWDLENNQVSNTLTGGQNAAAETKMAVAISQDGQFLAVRSEVWNTRDGMHLAGLESAIVEKTSCWPLSVAFSTVEDTLATGCYGEQPDLWKVPEGKWLKRMGNYSSWVEWMAYSPDGGHIAAVYGDPDYLVQTWQVAEGKPGVKLEGGHFTRVVYSSDGSMLATILAKKEYDQYGWPAGGVQLWDAETGEHLADLQVEDAVSLAFSPDNQILATGSLDGMLRLWDVSEGRLLVETKGHFNFIQEILFTPTGLNLLTGSNDGSILIWGIPGFLAPN